MSDLVCKDCGNNMGNANFDKCTHCGSENLTYMLVVSDSIRVHECHEPLDQHFNHGSAKPKYELREMKDAEKDELNELLYEAIFQTDEQEKLPKDIINKPELSVYINNWGKKDDICVVAVENDKILGAAWSRVWNNENKGFGYIDNTIPEIAIAVYKNYRNIGIGKKLLNKLIELNKKKGFKHISLSVSKENYAVKLYEALGFKTFKEEEKDLVMKLNITENK